MKYYIDRLDENEEVSALNVFVYIGNNEYYAPIGQHGELKEVEYLDECTEISLDEYKRISKGYYTPNEYLMKEYQQ